MKEQLQEPQIITEMPKLNPIRSLSFLSSALQCTFSLQWEKSVLEPNPLPGSGRLFCAQKMNGSWLKKYSHNFLAYVVFII